MPALLSLLRLLSDARFHSGQALGRALGVSRAAIWKSLQRLPQHGLAIDALPGRGYRLRFPLELLDAALIKGAMSPSVQDCVGPLELLFEVDSTNRWLMQRATGAAQGSVCIAEMQSAGRGRRGRPWVSPLGANLYLSLLWRFNEGPAKLAGLSLAVGMACVRALARCGANGLAMKWPNDILWDGRKLGGVLLEVAGESNGPCHVVIGIGINIGMPCRTDIDQPWADVREIVGDTSRNQLAGAVIDELVTMLQQFEQRGFEASRQEWMQHDAFAGKRVSLHLPNGVVTGIARGVDLSGHLLVETDAGVQRFASGEVSLRGA